MEVMRKELKKLGLAYRQQILAFLRDLISIPTSNPPGENYKECVEFLAKKLSEWGIHHKVIAKSHGAYPRFSVLGHLGKGESALHFHGHYDVVPPSTLRQFKSYFKKNLLYGRGSSDMKGGLASMLFALRLIQESGILLKRRITFSIVPDEETGGLLGTKYLLDSGLLPKPRFGLLMPEPTGHSVWKANRGALTYRIVIKGKSAHVGLAHQGINAFERMVDIACRLSRLKKAIEKRKTRLLITPLEANRSVMLLGGEAQSGFSFNVVPDKAYFTVDRRLNPEETLTQAKREILAILDEYRSKGVEMEVETIQEGNPSLASEKSQLALTLKEAIRDVSGRTPCFELCPGLCEIRFFNNRQIPAYAYGPGRLEVSHGPREHVRIEDVFKCSEIYALVALRLLKL